MSTRPSSAFRSVPFTLIMTACLMIFVARVAVIGADAHWLVAMGDRILRDGRVPDGLPFATAPTAEWPNVIVAAEVVFALLHELGDTGLVLAQLAADAAALILLVAGARRLGANDQGTAVMVFLVVLGSLPAMVVVRLQLLSLVPFALTLFLLRSEYRRPSNRIWWLAPIFAVWSNLHGAVLMGFAVVGCYLLFSRLRESPMQALLVGSVSFVALWLTPAGLDTGRYYLGVLGNEAAARGTDLWARPSLSSAFDVLMLVSALILLGLALQRRLPLWEYAALAGLALGTAIAARYGLWLLMLVAAPAAASIPGAPTAREAVQAARKRYLPWVAATVALALGAIVVARGDSVSPVRPAVVAELVDVAGTRTVLAPEPLVESLAVAGVRVWVADPIDAFSTADQAAYLDFLTGREGASRALDGSDVVVVEPGSSPEKAVVGRPDFRRAQAIGGWDVYIRIP